MRSTRKILTVITVTLILVVPALADISQKSKINGDNAIDIRVKQTAWNYGNGNINQDISVVAKGNYQMVSQDNIVLISDPDYAGDINNTMDGVNLIRLNLDQYSKNMGRGNIAQGIEVAIEGNVQVLDQDVILAISGD